MSGCYGVFGVTNYWEHTEQEYRHGKNLIDAVQQSGVRHFVMSTSPSYNAWSMGQFPVPQHDLKAHLEAYVCGLYVHTTFVHMSFYFENFLHFFRSKRAVTDITSLVSRRAMPGCRWSA